MCTKTVIFVQIENEYGPVEYEIGAAGKSYTKWAAEMAMGLGTGVPWIMCKQDDTPDPLVSLDEMYFVRKCFYLVWTRFSTVHNSLSWEGILDGHI